MSAAAGAARRLQDLTSDFVDAPASLLPELQVGLPAATAKLAGCSHWLLFEAQRQCAGRLVGAGSRAAVERTHCKA